MQRILEDNLVKHQKLMEESIQKHLLELKREVAQQKQSLARNHLDRLRQSEPLGPCFTCNSDHLKKTCPIELAKRGMLTPVSMANLIELDISSAEDLQGVEEMIQRFEDWKRTKSLRFPKQGRWRLWI